MNAFLRKLGWLAHRRRKEAELREELEFHLSAETEERKAAGLSEVHTLHVQRHARPVRRRCNDRRRHQ